MKTRFAAPILWSAVVAASPTVAVGQEERPRIYEIPEKIEPSVEMVTGREAIVGHTVLIYSPSSSALYLRPDGTGVSEEAGPPRKREEIKWAISDSQSLCIMGAGEEKLPDGTPCLRITLSEDEVNIWLPIMGPDDPRAALLLEGKLVRDNPLKL